MDKNKEKNEKTGKKWLTSEKMYDILNVFKTKE